MAAGVVARAVISLAMVLGLRVLLERRVAAQPIRPAGVLPAGLVDLLLKLVVQVARVVRQPLHGRPVQVARPAWGVQSV